MASAHEGMLKGCEAVMSSCNANINNVADAAALMHLKSAYSCIQLLRRYLMYIFPFFFSLSLHPTPH